MLTRDQQESFRRRGLVHVEGLLPVDRVAEAHAATMRTFEPPANRPHKGKLRAASQSRPVRDLLSPELLCAVEELTGGRSVLPMGGRPQLLVTMPNAQAWAVPSTVWHVDTPRVPAGMIGVQVFVFLHEVRHAGGGTLMVAGSHRLLNTGTRIGSKEIKRRLKRMPYFRDLMSKQSENCAGRLLAEPVTVTEEGGEPVEVQVVEFCGAPGDVWFTDLRMLHTLSPNTTGVPRVVLTQRYIIEELGDMVWRD